jgi:hypothetical protein
LYVNSEMLKEMFTENYIDNYFARQGAAEN